MLTVLLVAALGGGAASLLVWGSAQNDAQIDNGSKETSSRLVGEQKLVGGEEQRTHARVAVPREVKESPSTSEKESKASTLDRQTLQQAMLKLAKGIEDDRLAYAKAIQDGNPASQVIFLQNLLERQELALKKIQRGEYDVVPATEAMATRRSGDPDFSAFPTSATRDGSVVYLKVTYSQAESDGFKGTGKIAGKERWIKARSEIADHNRMSFRDRKRRVDLSDEAKQKLVMMRKINLSNASANLAEYMKKLEQLRLQELPWYFSIERVGYTASMPKWARKFFEQLGGR